MSESRYPPIPDLDARLRALQTSRSFIVQAPAGSGKTELLSQRYLALLALADEPEEVIALTFTRKAQGEMLDRIMAALEGAQYESAPQEPHRNAAHATARTVRARDEERGWHILDHPARLRILTIDALNGAITRRMPYLSRSGGALRITQDPAHLYRRAARLTVESLEDGGDPGHALQKLIRHLDNRVDRVEELLTGMLAQRDRWLRLVVPKGAAERARRSLEKAMEHVVDAAVAVVAGAITDDQGRELAALASSAARHIQRQSGSSSCIRHCEGMTAMPAAHHADLGKWRGIAELLLTSDGTWRRKVDRRHGFPQDAPDLKRRMMSLISELAANERLRVALQAVMSMPSPRYTQAQWSILEALLRVLPLAAAQLDLVFTEQGEADYTAVASRALRALGELDAPSDLALYLDYSIRHILVDEFQDTSYSQYELLERLTAGWQPGDGRTLFCVGDPMQSIYRFREADVGLFLQARRQGLPNVDPEALRLSMNFRSQRGLVDWVNGTFADLFPSDEDIPSGAVPYAPFHAHHPVLAGNAVVCHPQLLDDPFTEARNVLHCIQDARDTNPNGSIAVLVSARPHLSAILPELKRAGIGFQAIEIEKLLNRPLIQDLIALTRALTHLADRTAWLALLRAPWCGLTLRDIYSLCAGQDGQTTWDQLREWHRMARLTPDGQRRVAAMVPILDAALEARGRKTLHRSVEGAWLALGGPATLDFASDLNDAMAYLELLESLEKGGELFEPGDLELRLADLYAAPDVTAHDAVQIMTIHKAKGLQFDTVILPGLGRRPRPREKALLHWMETASAPRQDNVVLAPIQATGDPADPWHEYLHKLEQEREALERGRRLYVAATRARRCLHLLGHTTLDESDEAAVLKKPARGSPLELLWPAVRAEFEQHLADAGPAVSESPDAGMQKYRGIRRLSPRWQLPPPHEAVEVTNTTGKEAAIAPVEFDWAGETARLVGIIVHRELQRIADEGLEAWPIARVELQPGTYAARLEELGLPETELMHTAARVSRAISNALEDPTGRWILGRQAEAENELALSGFDDNDGLVNIVIDRTFVDEQGRRWLIDYKTSVHAGAGREAFLDNEADRYRPQLELYGNLLSKRSEGSVHLALYFPLLKAWRELGVVHEK